MKFCNFLLRVDGIREASLDDFNEVIQKGLRTYKPEKQKYLYSIEMEMMQKLIVAVEQNKHYSRGNKVAKAFDRVINEGWLHHENIKAAKEDMINED